MRGAWLPLRLAALSLLGGALPATAQRTDVQGWALATANIALTDDARWSLYLEAQGRLGDDASQLERLLLRPAVGRRLAKDVTLFLGYAWTPTFTDTRYESVFRGEHRLWQQLLVRHGGSGVAWQHRIRQEQRFLDDASGTSHRTRYLVRASSTPASGLGITGYHELFVTWNSVERGPQSGFDRSRVFAGPFLVRGPVRYEAGYVGEYGRRFGDRDRMIHALLVSGSVTF